VTGADLEDVPAFGDADPEDAWHPNDSVAELVANLIARRRRDRERPSIDLADVRARMFDEDLGHILSRVADLEGYGT